MIRPNWKSLLIGVAVVAMLIAFVPQADAFWGCRYGGCYMPYYSCYAPCYTSCYTPCCSYPCCGGYSYYLGYRRGPIRRLFLGPYRWYRGCYAGCWSSCCSYPCCYDVTCCTPTTPATAPAATPTPAVQKPVEPPTDPARITPLPPLTKPAAPAPAAPAPAVPSPAVPSPAVPAPAVPAPAPSSTNVPTRANSGLLTIWVPYGAKVTVNGQPTRSQGSRRQFVSYGLKPGFSYRYTVRAEIVRNGQIVADTKTIVLTAGDREALAFGFNALPARSLAAK